MQEMGSSACQKLNKDGTRIRRHHLLRPVTQHIAHLMVSAWEIDSRILHVRSWIQTSSDILHTDDPGNVAAAVSQTSCQILPLRSMK